jgi:hypothetical protein
MGLGRGLILGAVATIGSGIVGLGMSGMIGIGLAAAFAGMMWDDDTEVEKW